MGFRARQGGVHEHGALTMTTHRIFPATLALLGPVWLTACGMETAGTAAAVGVNQKNAVEQGRVVPEQVQQQLQKSADQAQQRADPLANGY